MKLIFFSLISLILSAAQAKTFVCNDPISPDIKDVSQFDSTMPTLESKTTFYNPDGTIKSSMHTVYVSPTSACDIAVNFKYDCKVTERQNSNGYDFYFTCQKQNVNGSLYVDNSGYGQFACNGENKTQLFGCQQITP